MQIIANTDGFAFCSDCEIEHAGFCYWASAAAEAAERAEDWAMDGARGI